MQIFIAGTIQGRETGYAIYDQAYRSKIQDVLRKYFPGSTVICPYALTHAQFGREIAQLSEMHRAYVLGSQLRPDEVGAPLTEVMAGFRELVRIASTSDLLIAYLPTHAPSMGTAMEMWAAFSNGVKVIAVTELTQNLAILSASTVIVRSIKQLAEYFESESVGR